MQGRTIWILLGFTAILFVAGCGVKVEEKGKSQIGSELSVEQIGQLEADLREKYKLSPDTQLIYDPSVTAQQARGAVITGYYDRYYYSKRAWHTLRTYVHQICTPGVATCTFRYSYAWVS